MNFDKTTTAETPLIRIVDDEERMRESLAFMLKHEGRRLLQNIGKHL